MCVNSSGNVVSRIKDADLLCCERAIVTEPSCLHVDSASLRGQAKTSAASLNSIPSHCHSRSAHVIP